MPAATAAGVAVVVLGVGTMVLALALALALALVSVLVVLFMLVPVPVPVLAREEPSPLRRSALALVLAGERPAGRNAAPGAPGPLAARSSELPACSLRHPRFSKPSAVRP